MHNSQLLAAPQVAQRSLQFVVRLRWALLLLSPLLFGFSPLGSVSGAMWWILGPYAALTLLVHVRGRRRAIAPGARLWYVTFAADLAIITLIVWVRGGLRTDAYLLYLLVTSEVGIILGQRSAMLMGAAALLSYALAVFWAEPDPEWSRLIIRALYLSLVTGVATYLTYAQRVAVVDSLTDSKTNLPNVRHFRSAMTDAIARHQQTRQPLAVAIFDVDHFRQLNATHGHPLADRVLEQLAALLANAERPGDLLARYGGEEFVLLLPQTDLARATVLLEAIRREVEATAFTIDQQHPPVRITLSAGVAELRPDEAEHPVLVRADEALLEAKQQGRNRVCVAG